MLHKYDTRSIPSSTSKLSKGIWTLQAHDEQLSALDINPQIPGFIATGSTDKTVKLWNVSEEASSSGVGAGPTMVVSRDIGVGKVFSANFAPDSQTAFRLAVAGSKGSLQVWDTSTNAAVRSAFASKTGSNLLTTSAAASAGKERLVGVRNDAEDSDDSGSDSEADEESGKGGVRIDGGADGWESASSEDDDAMQT
jgi:periodic tryptophan protein 1